MGVRRLVAVNSSSLLRTIFIGWHSFWESMAAQN